MPLALASASTAHEYPATSAQFTREAAMDPGTVRTAMSGLTTSEDANPLSRPCSEGFCGVGHAQIPRTTGEGCASLDES